MSIAHFSQNHTNFPFAFVNCALFHFLDALVHNVNIQVIVGHFHIMIRKCLTQIFTERKLHGKKISGFTPALNGVVDGHFSIIGQVDGAGMTIDQRRCLVQSMPTSRLHRIWG